MKCLPVVLVVSVTVGLAGCKSKSDKAPASDPDNAASPPPASNATDAAPQPAEPEVMASAEDVAFLVSDCSASGFAAEQCACVGQLAQAMLPQALARKMANAPEQDVELESYYSASDIQRSMEWISAANEECNLDPEADTEADELMEEVTP